MIIKDEELLTIPEVAARAKRTRAAVYLWIRDGRLKSVKVGAYKRVPMSAWLEFISQGTDQPVGQEAA